MYVYCEIHWKPNGNISYYTEAPATAAEVHGALGNEFVGEYVSHIKCVHSEHALQFFDPTTVADLSRRVADGYAPEEALRAPGVAKVVHGDARWVRRHA